MFQHNHRMATGKTLLVAQMDDAHLLNMIGAVVTWAERATSQFHSAVAQAHAAQRWQANGSAALAEAQRELYGLPDPPTLREAAQRYAQGLNQLAGRLEPYLLEAWTRQLSEADQAALAALAGRWRAAVGRDCALPSPDQALLPAPADEPDDDLPF